jgi:hypothetical protein
VRFDPANFAKTDIRTVRKPVIALHHRKSASSPEPTSQLSGWVRFRNRPGRAGTVDRLAIPSMAAFQGPAFPSPGNHCRAGARTADHCPEPACMLSISAVKSA